MFSSQREAKAFFVERIVAQAEAEGGHLSANEQWMLRFSESDPDLTVDPARLERKDMHTKNGARSRADDLRPQYDLTQLRGEVRGKYFARASAGTTVVVLEPDVAAAFPTSQAVNEALRALARVAQAQVAGRRKLPNKPLQPTSRKRRQTKKRRLDRAARS